MKRLSLVLALATGLSAPALAADFNAFIDSDHIEQGKNFKLRLTLSGAKADSGPDVSALKKSFTLVSEEQSSNATGVSNTALFSVDWLLTLLPKTGGELIIPAVTI